MKVIQTQYRRSAGILRTRNSMVRAALSEYRHYGGNSWYCSIRNYRCATIIIATVHTLTKI